MNKTAQTEFHRLFLIESLPEPLTHASSHLQIFDNYIENTRIRLRLMRDPSTSVWTRILQQRFAIDDGEATGDREVMVPTSNSRMWAEFSIIYTYNAEPSPGERVRVCPMRAITHLPQLAVD